MVKPLVDAMEAGAAIIEGSSGPSTTQGGLSVGEFVGERDSLNNVDDSSESYEQLVAAVKELQVVVWAPSRALNRDPDNGLVA
jgi:hypothetical protein